MVGIKMARSMGWQIGFLGLCVMALFQGTRLKASSLLPQTTIDYLFPHLPSTAGAWDATVVITNLGYEINRVTVESYQQASNGNTQDYRLETSFTRSLLPYQTLDISDQLPQQGGDRWLRVVANCELTGWIQFFQKQNPSYQATLPLQKVTRSEGPHYFPHVPSDRDQFWSGFALVNAGEQVPVTFQLWSANGENLNHLLNPNQQGLALPEGGKRLAVFEDELFDDRNSPTKVAWVSVEGGPHLQAMMLFGNRSGMELGDLAGVQAQMAPALEREYRYSLKALVDDVKGFVLVNPQQEPLSLKMKLYDRSGRQMVAHSIDLGSGEKRLAMWRSGNFELLGEDGSTIYRQDPSGVGGGMIHFEGSRELMTLQLTIRNGEQIEGIEALETATHMATANVSEGNSRLVIHNQAAGQNTINLWGFSPRGKRQLSKTWQLEPYEKVEVAPDEASLPALSYFLAKADSPISLQWQSGEGQPLAHAVGQPAVPVQLLPDPATLTVPPDPEAIAVRNEWADWVKRKSKPLASLTADTFEDLQFLHDAIGSRSLVQLGESSHGAREFNLSKVRIIKFLHQQMGFNVVAFESGFFECEMALTNNPRNGSRFLYDSIFAVWATEEVVELFEYIMQTQNTNRPLKLTGFDQQVSSLDTSEKRGGIFYQAMAPLNEALAAQIRRQELRWATTSFDLSFLAENSEELTPLYQESLRLVQAYLDQNPTHGPIDREQALLLKGSFMAVLGQIEGAKVFGDFLAYGYIRDEGMANLVGFLANEVYPEEKIAIWAHNAHIMHDSENVGPYQRYKSMGSYLAEQFRESLYTIGFYMYRGASASNTRERIRVRRPDRETSLEAILHTAGKPYLFLDLLNSPPEEGNSWINQSNPPIRAWYWGGPGYREYILKNHYDAILFIDRTSLPDYLPFD